MASLFSYKKGWNSQDFARFILAKFSFIGEPIDISNDVGSDFFCTIFEKRDKFIFPKNSFAIQIKSKKQIKRNHYMVDINKLIPHLEILEVPFFIGIVDRDSLKMEFYSGEYIPNLFSKGFGNLSIIAKLIQEKETPLKMFEEINGKMYLNFPKVAELDAKDDYSKIRIALNNFVETCKIVQGNIATKTSREYVFKRFGDPYVDIYFGNDSAGIFRDNFNMRLGEIFVNLGALFLDNHNSNIKKEYIFYKKIYFDMKRLYKEIGRAFPPEYLENCFKYAKEIFDGTGL